MQQAIQQRRNTCLSHGETQEMKDKETQIHKRICSLIEQGQDNKDRIIEIICLEFHTAIPTVKRLVKDHIQITYNKIKILA